MPLYLLFEQHGQITLDNYLLFEQHGQITLDIYLLFEQHGLRGKMRLPFIDHDLLTVSFYLSASEKKWPDKRGGHCCGRVL
jgi:hypothetical protein